MLVFKTYWHVASHNGTHLRLWISEVCVCFFPLLFLLFTLGGFRCKTGGQRVNPLVSESVFVCFSGTWCRDPFWDAACGDPRGAQRKQARHPHLPWRGTEPWVSTNKISVWLDRCSGLFIKKSVTALIRGDNWPLFHIILSCLHSHVRTCTHTHTHTLVFVIISSRWSMSTVSSLC